jgi:hypothetical protein
MGIPIFRSGFSNARQNNLKKVSGFGFQDETTSVLPSLKTCPWCQGRDKEKQHARTIHKVVLAAA